MDDFSDWVVLTVAETGERVVRRSSTVTGYHQMPQGYVRILLTGGGNMNVRESLAEVAKLMNGPEP